MADEVFKIFNFPSNTSAIFQIFRCSSQLLLGAKGNGLGGELFITDDAGANRIELNGKGDSNLRNLKIWDAAGRLVLRFASQFADAGSYGGTNYALLRLGCDSAGKAGLLLVHDKNGAKTIEIDGEAGDIVLKGGDCAEEYECNVGQQIEPGTVVVATNYGRVEPCTLPYDRKVVGVASGARGLKPGIVLNRIAREAGSVAVALAGKVYCRVDATRTPVGVGDLLTTSPVPGYAMKATDRRRSHGAIIGKSLEEIDGKRGYALMLVMPR